MNEQAFAKLRGKQVLVVEDEHLIALALADELEACGAIVVGPASSLASAIQLIEVAHPDAAVLDIQLQAEECYPVADILIAGSTPVLFTTGHDAALVPAAYRAIPCVQKPAPAAAVLKALERLL